VVVEKEGAGKVLVLAASAMIAHVLLCRWLPMVGVRALQSSPATFRLRALVTDNMRESEKRAYLGSHRYAWCNRGVQSPQPKGSLKELVEKT
jgi:hypothetical protein